MVDAELAQPSLYTAGSRWLASLAGRCTNIHSDERIRQHATNIYTHLVNPSKLREWSRGDESVHSELSLGSWVCEVEARRGVVHSRVRCLVYGIYCLTSSTGPFTIELTKRRSSNNAMEVPGVKCSPCISGTEYQGQTVQSNPGSARQLNRLRSSGRTLTNSKALPASMTNGTTKVLYA